MYKRQDYDDLEKDADKVADLCNQLCDDVDKLEVISDKYNRALRIFGLSLIHIFGKKFLKIFEIEECRMFV